MLFIAGQYFCLIFFFIICQKIKITDEKISSHRVSTVDWARAANRNNCIKWAQDQWERSAAWEPNLRSWLLQFLGSSSRGCRVARLGHRFGHGRRNLFWARRGPAADRAKGVPEMRTGPCLAVSSVVYLAGSNFYQLLGACSQVQHVASNICCLGKHSQIWFALASNSSRFAKPFFGWFVFAAAAAAATARAA